jgi:hypothetical protein
MYGGGGKRRGRERGGGGVGLVHDQNRGKVHKNTGSGSCPFHKGEAGGGRTMKTIDRRRGPEPNALKNK